MSRIGKKPVKLDKGVSAKLDQGFLSVKGPKGELKLNVDPGRYRDVEIKLSSEAVAIIEKSGSRQASMEQGLVRALVQNMATGVTAGFTRDLEIVGVGYKAEVKGKTLVINVGYSNPVNFPIPSGIEIKVDKQTKLSISGIDRQAVGEVAACIRRVRPPEPYKGKGIRYANEIVRRKVGKAAAGAAGG
jgi:large subunit ribosomal protein L6